MSGAEGEAGEGGLPIYVMGQGLVEPPAGAELDMGQVEPPAGGGEDMGMLEVPLAQNDQEYDGPVRKKLRLEEVKLEQRLGGIFSCAVCLDIPKDVIHQCSNGHLMCAACFMHLLADARLRGGTATCPNCRVGITHHAIRNRAVEKAVQELPGPCQFCFLEFPRSDLAWHETEVCGERITKCMYARIGCPWRGPFREHHEHTTVCIHPKKTGAEVMDTLRVFDEETDAERKSWAGVYELLSYEKISLNDLELKPYRTEEYVHKLYYETNRFAAFNHQFVIKAWINSHKSDPSVCCERQITYQLILKSKLSAPMDMGFGILRGPLGDMKLTPRLHQYSFTDKNTESPHFLLPLVDTAEVNRLLAAKTIQFRMMALLRA